MLESMRELIYSAAFLKRIQEHEAEARTELYKAVRKANAEGVPKAQIAKLTGISRQTVYNILDEK